MAAGGYLEVKTFEDGHSAGIVKLSPDCVRLKWYCNKILMDEWCYEDEPKALQALEAWDGKGEPEGWNRHPRTGRYRHLGNPEDEWVLSKAQEAESDIST